MAGFSDNGFRQPIYGTTINSIVFMKIIYNYIEHVTTHLRKSVCQQIPDKHTQSGKQITDFDRITAALIARQFDFLFCASMKDRKSVITQMILPPL
jgi:hypothetical protein